MLMVMQVYQLFELHQQSTDYLLFVFFATLSSYNMHWYFTPFISAEKERSKWSSDHRQVHLIIFITGALFAAYFGFKLIDHWQYIAIAVILTFLYSAPKLPIPAFHWLKKIAIGKTLFLTFVWTYVTTILPLLINEVEWTTS